MEIIDLSQEIYSGMPVHKSQPEVKITTYATHEEWDGLPDTAGKTPASLRLEFGEHTGTHVDALNHMDKKHKEKSIDRMSLSMFYTEGICLDFSSKGLKELITSDELDAACKKANLEVKKGDTVLLYTDHYRDFHGTKDWINGPGITAEAAQWLGEKQTAAFGVETMSPGVPGISNQQVHKICGQLGFTHYENLINLHLLVGRGRFRFIGLPLKIRGGTGSPVRAVAVFEE